MDKILTCKIIFLLLIYNNPKWNKNRFGSFKVIPVISDLGVFFWVRLNYATIHHHSKPSTTTLHHPAPAKSYPPPPTTTQNMDQHLAKAKIYSYTTSFWHCFNSSFFFKIRNSFTWRRFCVIKFWSVRFSNSKSLLHFMIFQSF